VHSERNVSKGNVPLGARTGETTLSVGLYVRYREDGQVYSISGQEVQR